MIWSLSISIVSSSVVSLESLRPDLVLFETGVEECAEGEEEDALVAAAVDAKDDEEGACTELSLSDADAAEKDERVPG